MHFERGLFAICKEKAIRRKIHFSGYRMLAQQIYEMWKELHRAKVASFSAGKAIRDGVFDARGGNGDLQATAG